MFLLYPHKDRELIRDLIDRCKRVGYSAIGLMVDVPVMGNRERDLRTGFNRWPTWSLDLLMSAASRPAWAVGQMRRGPLFMANYPRNVGAGVQIDSSITWTEVRGLIDRWGGPFALKGVMSADDARRAADIGASAVIVSNHGGRQLDGAAAPIEVLPEIARAVGTRVEVILDGGIRRGVHVLKALACGAKACSIGRPYLYGLGAGGEAGVTRALEILRSELVRAMKLCGCTNLEAIDDTLTRRLP
jgi:L-lactate dehydrogenase (cytochrome)